MALHRDSPDDYVTQPIDQLMDGDAPSDAPSPPPPSSSRHAAPEGARRSLHSLRSTFQRGGLWWKVLVVFVVIWALGYFGSPAPAPAAPVCPAPATATH